MIKSVKIPGAVDHPAVHELIIRIGGKSTHTKLANEDFQNKKGKELYSFFIAFCPAGIYRAFVKQIIKGDIRCNNYIGDHIGIDNKRMRALEAERIMKS
jgi:hypothetical protein